MSGETDLPTYLFNPIDESITSEGLPTLYHTTGLSAAVLKGIPVVCGGYDIGTLKVLNTCQKLVFDANTQQWNWEAMGSMNEARYSFTIEVVDDKIYAIGGRKLSPSGLATIEQYDSAADTWKYVTSMNAARYSASTTVLEGKIYACGGNIFDGVPQNNCEQYDPTQDTWTNTTATTIMTTGMFIFLC